MPRSIAQDTGAAAEDAAAHWLEQQGLAVIARNYRCRGGEIDIIARDGATYVFIEVRARRSNRFGGAAASITAAKQAHLIYAARHFLLRLGFEPACRFDAMLRDGETWQWLRNAFSAD